MSVPQVNSYNKYQGNSVTTEFSVSFPYNNKNDVKVYLKRKNSVLQETLVNNTDYQWINDTTIRFPAILTRKIEVEGEEVEENYTVQDPLDIGDILAIYRETPVASDYNFENQRRLFPEEVTHSDDLGILLIQELHAMISRALIMNETSLVTPTELVDELQTLVSRASEYVTEANTYSDLSKAWAIKTDGPVADGEYSSKYYAEQILPIASDITVVAGVASDITVVAGVATNINTVANDISSIVNVASNIDNIKLISDNIGSMGSIEIVGENITEVKAVAGSIVNVQEVANNRTNIDTVAGNITDVGTVAENIEVIKEVPYFAEKTQDYAEKAKLYAETAKGLPTFAEFTTNRIEPSVNGAYEKNGQIFDADDFTGPDNPYKLITEGKVPSIDLTEKVYNLPAIEGTPTIENGVISGFTKTDYARICIPSPREQFELIIKFNTPNLSSVQSLIDTIDTIKPMNYKSLILRLNTNGMITCWASKSGSDWNLMSHYQFNGIIFEANKDQYMKFEWKNGNYTLAKSEDGKNWSYCNNPLARTDPIVSMNNSFGFSVLDNAYPFKGTIDFKELKITIDNKVYWQYEYANEYEKQLALSGGCNKFGLDTVNRKFRLPTAKCREIVSQNTIGDTDITLYSDGYVKYKIHIVMPNQSYGSKHILLPIEMANTEYLVYGISRGNTSFNDQYGLQIVYKKTDGFILGYIVTYPDGEICVEGYSKLYHNVLRKMIQLSSEAKEMTSLEDYTSRIEKKANEEIAKVNLTGLDNKANRNLSNITEEAKEVIAHTGHFSYTEEDKILIPTQPWVAPADGYIVDSGFIENTSWWFTVNGVNYIIVGDDAFGSTMNHIHIEVKKGDSVNGFISRDYRFFFPKKV